MVERLQVSQCQDFALATVMLRKHADAAAIGAALGLMVPTGPACAAGGGTTLIGTGPGTWLAFAPNGSPAFATELAARLPGASVSDQSGGYVIFRLAGPGARELLQRGAAIDFDPSVFRVGSAAATVIAHIGVVIWQGENAATFHVAVFRSFAESFREWIDAVAPSLTA